MWDGGDQKEESKQEPAPTENSRGEVSQAGDQRCIKPTDTRHARSQWTGSLGFGATWFFILLHSQFLASLLNALPHVADHVSCFTHSSFKIISNYSILVINILALSRVFFLFTFIGQNPIKAFMPTADIITTDQISYQMFHTDHQLLQTDPAVPWLYKKWLQLQMQKNAKCNWGGFLWSEASKKSYRKL